MQEANFLRKHRCPPALAYEIYAFTGGKFETQFVKAPSHNSEAPLVISCASPKQRLNQSASFSKSANLKFNQSSHKHNRECQ